MSPKNQLVILQDLGILQGILQYWSSQYSEKYLQFHSSETQLLRNPFQTSILQTLLFQ